MELNTLANQSQLVKMEWDAIDIPVPPEEISILKLIVDGFQNVNITEGKTITLINYLKIEPSANMHDHLFKIYLQPTVDKLKKQFGDLFEIKVSSTSTVKKADLIRIGHTNIQKADTINIAEFVLLDIIEKIVVLKSRDDTEWCIQYFTLYKFMQNTIHNLNPHLHTLISKIIKFEDEIDIYDIVINSVDFIEKNKLLLKYGDNKLYDHQKQLFSLFNNKKAHEGGGGAEEEEDVILKPSLTLYTAPTGTGKTLSPLGLSEKYKVIFVCGAKHVGVALARSAVSIGKKIAFAFGCTCAADIRLHFNAATEFARSADGKLYKILNYKNKKSGKYAKIDNTIGDKVEIMICDLQSYIPAMLYMQSFNDAESMITFWDEPTISMDYEKHDLHAMIERNWTENLVPTMILSSATLPKIHELGETIASFMRKFPGATVNNITSFECKKSIPILNKFGLAMLPHFITSEYDKLQESIRHCEENLTLLRYFDLNEAVKFIKFVEENNFIPGNCKISRCFASIGDVDMISIKLHYIKVVKKITRSNWPTVYESCIALWKTPVKSPEGKPLSKSASVGPGLAGGGAKMAGKPLAKSLSESAPDASSSNFGIYISTKDAHTLTCGPTIYLADDVEKIATFCIQQAALPSKISEVIFEKISLNNSINEKILQLEQEIQNIIEKNSNKELNKETMSSVSKLGNDRKKAATGENKLTEKFTNEIEMLRSKITSAEIPEVFVPNKIDHLKKWTGFAWEQHAQTAFTCCIDEQTIVKIMMLTGVPDNFKLLLLMGIGVFTTHKSIEYTEIMKTLADSQHLFLIIASSDYIYGTNYQFCHGYLGKDLNLTQEKIIQSLGRIGRNNIQQSYSVRLRDDKQIDKLFYREENKREVRLMNKLFS
jgi:hypothetical protein